MPRPSADRAPRHRCRTITSCPIAESSPRQTSDEAYGALVGQYEKDTNTAKIRRSNEGLCHFRRSAPGTEPGSARSLSRNLRRFGRLHWVRRAVRCTNAVIRTPITSSQPGWIKLHDHGANTTSVPGFLRPHPGSHAAGLSSRAGRTLLNGRWLPPHMPWV